MDRIAPADLTIALHAGPEADEEELQQLSQRLRHDLLELDVDSVEGIRQDSVPAGSKGAMGGLITLGSLAVSLGPVALTALLNMLQSWLKRHHDATVNLKMGGDEITVTGSPSKEQQQLIELWLSRHKA